MPSLLIHLLIPPLVLLASRRFPPRLVLALLPFSLLPDLDFFVGPHRALLHTIFLPAALGVLAWRLQRASDPRALALGLAAFYLVSHSAMDLFAGGVVLLWPLSVETFFIDALILIDTRTLEVMPIFDPGTETGIPQVSPVYEYLNGDQAAILLVTLLVALYVVARRAREVRREVVVIARQR